MADMNEIVDLAKPAFTAAMASLNEIVDLLKRGQVVVIPTDTVYGLALLVDESSDPNILYQIKGRPTEKSIPWLIGSFSDFLFYSESPPDWAVTLAKRHWPGALTLVCKASAQAPAAFLADDGSLALRMPDHPDVLELIKRLGAPLAVTSANISGQPPVTDSKKLDQRILSRVAAVLTNSTTKPCHEAIPSTIISCLNRTPVILRQGVLDLTAELAQLF